MADLIYVDPATKGAIYQGGKTDVEAIETDAYHYDLVVLAANNFQPKHLFTQNPVQLLHIPFDDAIHLSESDRITIRKYALDASLIVLSFIHKGKSVLISCNAGKNRSGLITAFCLMRCCKRCNWDASEAIKLIQEKRPESLTNPDFIDIIMEGPDD